MMYNTQTLRGRERTLERVNEACHHLQFAKEASFWTAEILDLTVAWHHESGDCGRAACAAVVFTWTTDFARTRTMRCKHSVPQIPKCQMV